MYIKKRIKSSNRNIFCVKILSCTATHMEKGELKILRHFSLCSPWRCERVRHLNCHLLMCVYCEPRNKNKFPCLTSPFVWWCVSVKVKCLITWKRNYCCVIVYVYMIQKVTIFCQFPRHVQFKEDKLQFFHHSCPEELLFSQKKIIDHVREDDL